MRHLAPFLLLIAFTGCSFQPRLRPYTTDGCSLFPDGTAEHKNLWLKCCQKHDAKYWAGGSKAERLSTDLELRACVAAVGEPAVAELMLNGVRAGGTPHLPTSFRWGYGWSYMRGYKTLTGDEIRLVSMSRRTGQDQAVAISTSAVETETKASSTTAANVGPLSPNRVLPGEPVKRKNYIVPAVQIPIFLLTLNGFDRLAFGAEFESTLKTSWDHARKGPWVVDQDDFAVNQIGHPYQGSLYYGFARASGLNFWEGLIYSNAGSVAWELTGETSHPSINDQVASGNAGALIGESLFRMANLVLEGGDGPPGLWREWAAAFISPPTALNRYLFGERYTPILKSRDAAIFTQLKAGAGRNTTINDPGSAASIGRDTYGADFSMAYGLPGRTGYLYLRPFDYFTFELSGLRQGRSTFANMMTRGLLFGGKYEMGDDYQGIWGLYGTFDYFSPQVFRFSTTAASLGSTFQWRVARKVALQGSVLTGLGYGTAGTIAPQDFERDYHYGAAPQGLASLRFLFGKLAMLDTTARGYYVTGLGSSRAPGAESIGRLDTSFFVRVFGPHALGVTYALTSREAKYNGTNIASRHQLVETVGVAYNLLGDVNFGAVEMDRD
jgi:hypothetical protein